MPEKIKNFIGNGKKYGVNVKYVIEDKPLGTAGAVKNAEDFFDDTMLVLNGDILTDINLKKLIEHHEKNNAIATITLHEVDDPTSYGLVETDSNMRITNFLEKPNCAEVNTKNINAGVYVFDKRILSYIPRGKNYSLERGVFPNILEKGEKVMAYITDSYWIDIGTVEKYMQANFDILEKRFKVPIISPKTLRWNVKVGKKTDISLRASLRGPIVIGDFCKIEKGIYNPLTIIGNHCEIEKDCVVERSIIWDNVKIGKSSVIKNSIIGKNCEIQSYVSLNGVILGDSTKITHFSKLEGNL